MIYFTRVEVAIMERSIEKAKKQAEEYKEIRTKINKIAERRHLAIMGEESEEKILYKKIIETIYNRYQNTNALDFKNFNEESDMLYQEIKELVGDYTIDKKEEKEAEQKEEIER